ncbi:hypothetical protein WMY93_014739 [Mugilogobius chulae]|uniref:Ig-like domain-containing protein n=1 Tax=Mugilogobius chulae TaxID=88201 RepID=A0AAW0P7E7_9GOBI
MLTPSQPIIVSVGSDVTLPCQLDPVKDLRDMVVDWARMDLTPFYVHIRRDGRDLLIGQNPLYLGRTALSESRLQKGDMTLSLTRVKPSDRGTYRCYIPQMDIEAEVTLLVVSVGSPSVSLTKERSGSPVLRCESRGWYPKPELEWLDSEGTVLLRTEAQKEASDELFSVSSRLSVEQKHGNTFTCRVRQKESGQTRETQLILTDEFLESCASCSVAWILFGLGLVLAVGVTAAFIVWKFKPKSKVPQSKWTELEEMEKMVKNEESTDILNYLKNTVPELKENMEKTEYDMLYVNDVINKLTQTKSFIMKLKTLEEVILESFKRKGELEGELKQTMRLSKKEKRHMETESEQKTKEEESIDKEISKIDKIVRKSSEKKGKLEGEEKQMKKQMEKEKKRLEEIKQAEVKDERENDPKETDKSKITGTEAEGEKMEK